MVNIHRLPNSVVGCFSKNTRKTISDVEVTSSHWLKFQEIVTLNLENGSGLSLGNSNLHSTLLIPWSNVRRRCINLILSKCNPHFLPIGLGCLMKGCRMNSRVSIRMHTNLSFRASIDFQCPHLRSSISGCRSSWHPPNGDRNCDQSRVLFCQSNGRLSCYDGIS